MVLNICKPSKIDDNTTKLKIVTPPKVYGVIGKELNTYFNNFSIINKLYFLCY